MLLDRKQIFLVWLLGMFIIVELLTLFSLIYFAKLPFFIFVFVVGLKLISLFLIGAITVFLSLFIFSRKPKEVLESWKNTLLEYTKYLWSSLLAAITLIFVCIILGAIIMLILRKFYHITPLDSAIDSIRHWLNKYLK